MTKIEFTIKNDEKGYFGCFSKTGKNSVEILSNIRQQDALLNPKENRLKNKEAMINFLKRNGYHNIHGDDQKVKMIIENELNDSMIEDVDEDIDIFKKVEANGDKNKSKENKNNKKNKKKEIKIKYFHRLKEELYKYHDLHMQNYKTKKPILTPDCTKYAPNKDFVMRRILVSPNWKTRKGRSPLFGVDNTKYYLNHEDPLKNIGHTFIDMDKQTMRGNLITSHDLRIITTKTFVPKNQGKKKIKKTDVNNNNNNKKYNKSVTNSEYLSLDKAKSNMNLLRKYEQNYVKSNKKRVASAITSSTRPQTGVQKNLTTLTSNNSKYVTNTSNSLAGNRNITSISNNLNKLLNEDNNSEESLTESNDSYNIYKTVYKRQLKPKETEKIKNVKKMIGKYNTFKKSNKKIRPKSSYMRRKLIKGPDFDKTMSREHYYMLNDKGSVIPFSLPNFKQVRERPLTMVVYERPVYKKYTKKEIKGITPDMYNDIYKYLDNVNNHKRCLSPNFAKMNANYKKNDKNPLPLYMRGITSRGACDIMNEVNLKMNNFAEGKFISNYTSFWPKKSFNKIVNLNLLNSKTFMSHMINDSESEHYLKKSLKFYRKNYKELIREGLLNKFDNVTFKSIKPKISKELNIEKFLEKYFENIKN